MQSIKIESGQFHLNSKCLLLISMLYITISITATALAYRFVSIGPTTVSGATVIFPLNFFVIDIIAEVYGFSIAKKIIWMGLLCELLFAMIAQAILYMPYPTFWHLHNEYEHIFGSSLRFVLSGIIADLVSMFTSAYLISKWKILMNGKYFGTRSIGATIISDFFMTLIIGISAFVGTVPSIDLLKILASGYLLHVAYALIFVWITVVLVNVIKKIEKTDNYDANINYNPFGKTL